MRTPFLCLFAAAALLAASISTPAWAQRPRGRVLIDQTSSICNIDTFEEENDIDVSDNDDNGFDGIDIDDNDINDNGFGGIDVDDDDDDDDDVVVTNQPCTIRAGVRDASGRRISGVNVRLFRADSPDELSLFNNQQVGDRDVSLAATARRTDQAGNASFSVPVRDDDVCYQARTDRNFSNRQVASLRSEIICISPDETVAFDPQTGDEIGVVE